MAHDETIAKWMENPQFRKAVFEFNAQYAVLDKILATRKTNCFGSIGAPRKGVLSESSVRSSKNQLKKDERESLEL